MHGRPVEQDSSRRSTVLLEEQVERFFASYRDAFNRDDPAAVARHVAVPCLLVERELTTWSTADEVLQAMTRLLTFYRESGAGQAHFVIEGLLAQGEAGVVANVAWSIDQSDGRDGWNFRTGYNLRRHEQEWRIVCFTTFEDDKRPIDAAGVARSQS
jgi:ketosteroid isomerase-like protein